MTEDQIKDFIAWLTQERHLDICNVSNAIWWPIGGTDWIAAAYLKDRGHG